jgi:hypothetical protein
VPLGAGAAVTFEIGDATTYAPLSLVFGMVSGSGTVTASTTAGEHPDIGASVIDPTADVNRWWSVVNGGTVFDAVDVTFSWDPADVDVGADPTTFVVGRRNGSWVLPTVIGATPTSITAVGLTSFSEFAIGQVEDAEIPDTAAAPTAGALPLLGLVTGLAALVAILLVLGLAQRTLGFDGRPAVRSWLSGRRGPRPGAPSPPSRRRGWRRS